MVSYFAGLLLLIIFGVLAYWRGNPVIFMISAGISLMLGLYSPDAFAGLSYSTIGVGVGLMLIMYAFVCVGYAYANLFRQKGEEEE